MFGGLSGLERNFYGFLVSLFWNDKPIKAETMAEPTGWLDFGSGEMVTAVVPSFFVVLVPAVATGVGLGPLTAVACLGWLQVMQPGWSPGGPVALLAQPTALTVLTLLAMVEFFVDKVPGWDRILARFQRPVVTLLGALASGLVLWDKPLDIQIGGAFLGAIITSFVHSAVIPTRMQVLDAGVGPFVTPIASIVQSFLCIGCVLSLATRPILGGVLLLVVVLSCGFLWFLDRQPIVAYWKSLVGLSGVEVQRVPEAEQVSPSPGEPSTTNRQAPWIRQRSHHRRRPRR
jgi:hypothetical protein